MVQEGMADYVHFCLICKNMHLDNLTSCRQKNTLKYVELIFTANILKERF